MAIKKSYIIGITVIIIVIVAAVAVYYIYYKPPPAKLPEKIYIGAAICLTGPWAGPAADASKGIRDYWTLVNERGGIDGIPVELLEADNEYDPDTTLTVVIGWLADHDLSAIFTCGTHVVAALYPTMEDAKIPYTDPSMAGAWANASEYPYYFLPPFSSYTDHFRAYLKWFNDTWTEERAPKLAIIWETKAFGWMVEPGVESYAEYLGYEVTTEVAEIGSTDVSPQLARIQGWGPDVIATIEAPSETGLILGTAAAMGIDAEFVNFYYAFFWEPLLGIYGAIAEGKYVGGCSVPYGYDVPGMADLIAANDRFHPGETRNSMYVYGWVHSMIVEEALKRAAEAGDLSGDGVKAAWESISNFDTGGLTPPVTYTSEDHRGTTTVWVWKVEGGQYVRVAEETFPRDDAWFGK